MNNEHKDKQDGIENLKQLEKIEPWGDKNWRQYAAIVYLGICIFDFIVMPIAKHTEQHEVRMVVVRLLDSNPDKQFILNLVDRMDTKQWEPLTLRNGGLFHLSFGAILTGAVLMRGQERKITIQNGNGKN